MLRIDPARNGVPLGVSERFAGDALAHPGHSRVLVTERNSHFRPRQYNLADRNRLAADFDSDSVRSAQSSGFCESKKKDKAALIER